MLSQAAAVRWDRRRGGLRRLHVISGLGGKNTQDAVCATNRLLLIFAVLNGRALLRETSFLTIGFRYLRTVIGALFKDLAEDLCNLRIYGAPAESAPVY